MRLLRLLLAILALSFFALAQEPEHSHHHDAVTVRESIEILTDTMGVDFRPYLGGAIRNIRKNWFALMPDAARAPASKQGQASVEFTINKDGSVTGMRLVRASGDPSLDRAAWAGIMASTPFSPLPAEFKGQSLGLRLHFIYNPEKHAGENHEEMNARGEKAMGFSQTATTHHFTLLPDGGFVQVQANEANDTANRDHIRMHLQMQAKKFAAGEFSLSEMTHDRVLPGTPQMQTLKSAITYKYEEIERGGRLRISSKDAAAVAAIHDFLKFQIEDHKTGDAPKVKAE